MGVLRLTSSAILLVFSVFLIDFCLGDDNQPRSSRSDLTMVNSCSVTLYIEGRMGAQGQPLPGHSTTFTRVDPGQSVSFDIPATGAQSTRFWAKYGCDDNGRNCLIGDSMQYWPDGGCPLGGCQPPIDSLFEATWGCEPGSSCNTQNPTTWWDTSQVDGWTIPYQVHLYGETNKCDCSGTNCPALTLIDASRLDLASCPRSEDASNGGLYNSFDGLSMKNLDLRYRKNNMTLGCMSPCKRLTYSDPFGFGMSEASGPALMMCCPTPNPTNCLQSQGCVTAQECKAGPIENSNYVRAVHRMSPGVYAYSYDDGVGLHACPAGTVQYEMEFCPSGSTPFPDRSDATSVMQHTSLYLLLSVIFVSVYFL
ncbi:putative carbohydrate binding domain [Planoprotostelium fungivorum]|uniref:Putative carbohydrate binding domain n=1 Tax=Planoprotostelium fungivorum TaxID=1890364 RepID=A0A2P6NZ14_9EUKA|nr:putative carbohydrate binding domain [Planoprotostelium fungivorum]